MAKKSTRSGGSKGQTLVEFKRKAKQHKVLLVKRDKLANQLEEVEGEVNNLEQILLYGSLKGGGPLKGHKRFRNKMNLIDSLKSVLKGQKMGVTETVIAVRAIGYRSTSPSFKIIVSQTLSNHPKHFKRISRGVYTSK